MQHISGDYLRMLAGSQHPVVTVDAWYGGRCVARDLQVADGTLSVSAGQAIRSSLSLTVVDPAGELRPSADGGLSPFGARLVVRGGMKRRSKRDTVQLGVFPITEASGTPQWGWMPGASGRKWYRRPAVTEVSAGDNAIIVQREALLSATQPKGATVKSEIARLLQGVVPWRPPAGVADKAIPSDLTYDADRLQTVCALAEVLDCDLIFDSSGAATLQRRRPPLVSVWTVPRGDQGVIASVDLGITADGVYNAVVARASGDSSDAAPRQAIAYDRTAGIGWGQQYGRVPLYIDVQAATQKDLQAAADAELAAQARRRWQTITITCPVNYALEVGDVITVPMPRGEIVGQVVSASWPLVAGEGTMSVGVSVDPFVLVGLI